MKRVILVLIAAACFSGMLFAEPQQEEGPVSIEFWYPYGEGSWTGDFLAGKIAEFNESHPDITVAGQSYEGYGAIIEGLQRSALAKNLPGIAAIGYGYDSYIVQSGLPTALTDLIADDNYFSDFYSSLTDITTFDGKTYGIPLALSVAEVFYHRDIFEKAGLDPDNPPKTWDEFIAASETIHDKLGIFGSTFALDDPWTFETAVRSNGGAFLGSDGKASLDSDIAVDTLTDWADGVKGEHILYNADFFETLQTFGAGQVAMFAVSSYGTLYYHANLPGVSAMPWPAGKGKSLKSPAGGNSLYIFGNSKAEREASAEFLMFISSAEANAEWAQNSGYLPTRKSSLDMMDDFIAGIDNYATAVSEIPAVVPPTQFPGRKTLQINEIIMGAIEAALLGVEEPRDALTEATGEINTLINAD